MKKLILLIMLCVMAVPFAMAQEKSITDLEKLAKGGDVNSMLEVGMRYYNLGSFKKAADWFEKAAKKDSPDAKYNLATMLLEGQGKKRNTGKALKLMEEAAYGNVANAQYMMGYWNEEGLKGYEFFMGSEMDFKPKISYVTPNSSKAYEWFEKAAANGQKDAIEWFVKRGQVDRLPAETQQKVKEEQAAAKMKESVDRFMSIKDESIKYKRDIIESDVRRAYESEIESNGEEYVAKVIAEIGKTDPSYAAEISKIKEKIEKEELAKAEAKKKEEAEIAAIGKSVCDFKNGIELREKGGKYILYKNGAVQYKDWSKIKQDVNRNYFVWDSAGQIGYLNQDGKLVVPFGKYPTIVGAEGGFKRIVVEKGNKVGAVDFKTGVQTVPIIYDEYMGRGREGRMVWGIKSIHTMKIYVLTSAGKQLATKEFEMSSYGARAMGRWLEGYLGYLGDPAYGSGNCFVN